MEDPSGCLPPSPASPASAILLESTWSVLLSRSVEMPVGQIRNFTCFKQLWPLTKVVLKIWLFKGKFFLERIQILSFAIAKFMKDCSLRGYSKDCRNFFPRTYGPGDIWTRGHLVQGTYVHRIILFR